MLTDCLPLRALFLTVVGWVNSEQQRTGRRFQQGQVGGAGLRQHIRIFPDSVSVEEVAGRIGFRARPRAGPSPTGEFEGPIPITTRTINRIYR